MLTLAYQDARPLMKPGDPVFTAEPDLVAAAIRLYSGDEQSHVGGITESHPDPTGRMRVYLSQANAGKGVHEAYLSDWIAHRRGKVWWIPTPLTDTQRAAFMEFMAPLYGHNYEDVRDFVGMALGRRVGDDEGDMICSVLYGAAFHAATGVRLVGRPFFRLARSKSGRGYPLTPGAVWRGLDGDRLAVRILP